MAGRGRGRGRGALQYSEINKPGQNKQEDDGNDDEMAAITARLQELPVDTKDWTLDEDLCDLLTMSSAAVRTEQQLTQIAHSVYERCLTNREFVNTGSLVCKKLCHLEAGNVKFRSCILKLIQRDYKDRDKLKAESIEKYLSSVSFLCQVYNTVRLASGEPMGPLATPLCSCLQELLGNKAGEAEVECACEQLKSVGGLLQSYCPDKVAPVIQATRDKIISDTSSSTMRSSLLEIVELAARGWPSPQFTLPYSPPPMPPGEKKL